MIEAEKQLGEAITVLNGKPVKFAVKVSKMGADSGDLHNRTPSVYSFDSKADTSEPPKSFDVLVSDDVIFRYFENTSDTLNDSRLHQTSISFGLFSLRNSPKQSKFDLSKEAYSDFDAQKPPSGPELRMAILQFCYDVYLHLPDENLSYYHIMENLLCTREAAELWLKNLRRMGFLEGLKIVDSVGPRYGHSTGSYKINPKFESNVRDELKVAAELRTNSAPKPVFVVHGRDYQMRDDVVEFLRNNNVETIVLEELPSEGKTVIEKLEKHANNIGFAVIAVSPDDEGRLKGAKQWKGRARQNVVFEHGLFTGLLRRKKVRLIIRDPETIERGSDYHDLEYIPYDDAGMWRAKLSRELRKAGYSIDPAVET